MLTNLWNNLFGSKNNVLKIQSFNLFYDNSRETKIKQLMHINNSNDDIVFLQEYDDDLNLDILLTNFIISEKVNSHMGYTLFLVNKKLKPQIKKSNCYKNSGVIIETVETIYGKIICGSIHLLPHTSRRKIRERQIEDIYQFINDNIKPQKIPIIIAGDTNMYDDENIIDQKNFLEDVYIKFKNENNYKTYPSDSFVYFQQIDNFVTYPNYKIINKKCTPKRYDRILINDCEAISFKTFDTYNSDHMAIYAGIKIAN